MESAGNIIVFRHFDSSIDANIAKSKLDAFGIPCFLTEENIANLYPGQPFMSLKVRLHLFEKDREQAYQVLSDIDLTTDAEAGIVCPVCGSNRTIRDFPKADAESLTYLFFGVLFPHKKVNHCLDCDKEF